MYKYFLFLLSATLLSCSTVSKYKTQPEVLAWEKDIQKFEQLDKSKEYPNDAILFAGSSSIRLWSSLERDMYPFSVIQRGYGGARLSDFAVYASRIFKPHPCSAIVIFIANDITGSDRDKNPQEVAALYRNLLKTIRKSHHDTPVFWIEVTPTSSRWKVWSEIKKANDLIRKICDNQKNTYFIQTDYAFLNENGQPDDKLFLSDKLHLNAKGYEVWTEIIKKELKSVLRN